MRVVNLIEVVDGNVSNVNTYGIFEDQLSQDVVEQVEREFKKRVLQQVEDFHLEPMSEEDVESYVEDGFYKDGNGYSISIVWSNI